MKRTVVITDLTQMPSADGVCIAGIDQNYQSIRPVLPPPGVLREHLYIKGELAILPRAKVRFDFHQVPIEPPHIEDLGFDPKSIVYEGSCTEAEWVQVLRHSSFSTVEDIYDGLLKEHRWVEPDADVRSLGTVSEVQIENIEIEPLKIPGHFKPRLAFRDSTGWIFRLPVSDLSFRTFVDYEIGSIGTTLVVSKQILKTLQSANRTCLRIGLPSPWRNPSTGKVACWMQVTGIYTFPDYLGGRSFADFETTMQTGKTKAYGVEEIREKYPKAYAKWTEDEDSILRNEYLRGKTVEELASSFQRKPGAIRSRLLRLGLL